MAGVCLELILQNSLVNLPNYKAMLSDMATINTLLLFRRVIEVYKDKIFVQFLFIEWISSLLHCLTSSTRFYQLPDLFYVIEWCNNEHSWMKKAAEGV